jgi:hypothetical protein
MITVQIHIWPKKNRFDGVRSLLQVCLEIDIKAISKQNFVSKWAARFEINHQFQSNDLFRDDPPISRQNFVSKWRFIGGRPSETGAFAGATPVRLFPFGSQNGICEGSQFSFRSSVSTVSI